MGERKKIYARLVTLVVAALKPVPILQLKPPYLSVSCVGIPATKHPLPLRHLGNLNAKESEKIE